MSDDSGGYALLGAADIPRMALIDIDGKADNDKSRRKWSCGNRFMLLLLESC